MDNFSASDSLLSQWLLRCWLGEIEPYVDDAGIDADIPLGQRRTLAELTRTDCRWPVGDPSHSDFFYCGAEASPGRPYCPAHCARAYRVTSIARNIGSQNAESGLVPGRFSSEPRGDDAAAP